MGTSYVFGRKKGENVCTRTVLPPLNSHRLRTQRWQIQKETIGTVIAKMTKTETCSINLSVMHLLAANVNIYVMQMIMLFFETFCLTCLVVLNSWSYIKKEVISNYGSTYLSEHEIG